MVVGHWTIAMIIWDQGLDPSHERGRRTPWLWLATWIFQVMPIFFFVGGFANLVAYDSYRRRGESTGLHAEPWVRLLRPALAFLAAWTVVQWGCT